MDLETRLRELMDIFANRGARDAEFFSQIGARMKAAVRQQLQDFGARAHARILPKNCLP
jgi:hypothetical protein